MRGEILRTLAAYGGPTADAVLRVAVRDTDADVRVIVCDLWGKRSDAEAVQVLAGVLASDSDRDVRMAAARGLGHSHDPAAVRALGTALDDTDPAMRYRAMRALRESTGKDIGTDPSDADRWRQYVKTGEVPPQVVGASESSRGIIRSGWQLPAVPWKPWEIAVFDSLLSACGRCLLQGLLYGLALPLTARIRTIR